MFIRQVRVGRYCLSIIRRQHGPATVLKNGLTRTRISLLFPQEMSTPEQFIKFIDDNANKFIGRLAEAVAIPR